MVEHVPGTAVFDAIAEAIAALRGAGGRRPAGRGREAHMRKVLRRAVKDGFERIAVVCGAWHVPALQDLPPRPRTTGCCAGCPR